MSAPKPKPARLPAAERRQQIIESSRQVFITHGLAGAGTRQLSEAAGINSALLYHYFENKEAIFDAAVVEPLREMVQDLLEITLHLPDEDSDDQQREIEVALLQMLRAVRESLPLLGIVLFSDEDRSRAFYREHLAPLLETSYLAGNGNSGGPMAAPPERWVLIAVFGMCFGLAMDEHLLGAELIDEEMVHNLTQFVLAGMSVAPHAAGT